MKQSYKSWFCVMILVIIFSYGIVASFNNSYIGFCNADAECVMDLVEETKDFNLCKFSVNESNCYTNSAILLDDYSLCNLSFNSTLCYMNFASIKKDVFICDYVVDDYRDKCIFDVAISEENAQICLNSLDSGLCYYSYALHFMDVNICDLSEKYKSKCIKSLVG